MGEEPFEAAGVRGVLHRPATATGQALALTHGAGSDCHSALLVSVARAFAEAGFAVLRHDLPFRQLRPQGPPFPAAAARDREGVAQAVEALRGLAPGRIFAGGHSYGGRQTAMAAAEHPGMVDGLLLLSYPLHPPGKPDKPRTAFFPDLRTPGLFVHGSADPFGSPEELRLALALIAAPADLLLLEGARHDLKPLGGRAAELPERLRRLTQSRGAIESA